MTKTTLHYQRIPSWAERAQRALDCTWVKLVNPPMGADPFPGLRKCIRIWTDEWDRPLIAQGRAGADEYWRRMVDTWLTYQALGWGECVYELPNEPECNTPTGLLALDAFTRRCIELAGEYDLTLAVLNLPEGNPGDDGTSDVDVSRRKVQKLAPCVRLAGEMGHLIGLHGYWRPGVEGPTGEWHAMRFKKMLRWWADAGVPVDRLRLALTEWGIDGGIAGGPRRKSWRTLLAGDKREYARQLAEGEQELRRLNYVEFAAVFTAGPHDPWWDFEIDEELAMTMAEHFVHLSQVIDITASLPRHPSKVWRHRDQAPNCIVIHHSVTPSDYPIERIAEYHISRDYPGIAYHYVIPGNGKVYQTNDDMAFTWHGNDGNTGLGVCLLGDFTECEPTSAQIASARWLIADLRGKYGDLPVLGHKECGRAQTECPGRTWEQWKHKLIVAAPSSPVPSPSEPSEEENMGIQAFDWQGRPTTVEALQAKYKFRIRQAEGVEAGQEVFRIKAIREKAGDTAVIVRCTVDGEPDAGRMVAGYWPDAPQSNPSPFPWDWYPNYTLAKTNANGEVAAVVMGSGSVIRETGPHAVWVVSPSTKSDCLDGIGWLGGTDHMHVDVEFALVVQPEPAPDVPESHLEAIRNEGWNLAGVDYNPEAALIKYAQLHGLGAPLGQEGRVEVGGKRYAVQPFRDVIVYAVEGEWDRIKELDY